MRTRTKKYRNFLNRSIKKAKSKYYKTRLQSNYNKSKTIWSVINEILSKRKSKTSTIKKIKKPNGTPASQLRDIANVFNNYFVNVGEKLASKILHQNHTIYLPSRYNGDPSFESDFQSLFSNG